MKKSLFLVIVFAAAAGAAFGASPSGSRLATQSEESDLYGLFLDKWTGSRAQVVHIARVAEAPPAEAMTEYAACLKGLRLAKPTSPLPPFQLSETSLALKGNVRLVDPKKWRLRDPGSAIASGKPTSKAVSDGFAAGLLTLSRVIFDEERQVAIFSYSFVCGALCGSGGGVIFDGTATGWKLREMPWGGWVS